MANHKEREIINGYIVLKDNQHHKSFKRGNDNKPTHVYEHHVIAEEMLGRELRPDEEVHHLDQNKVNNSPDNLLVLEDSQHAKLHSWIDKNVVIPKPKYALRTLKGCVRCKFCEKPIDHTLAYCSQECVTADKKENILTQISRDTLQDLVKNNPITKVGKMIGLSDNGVRKRCVSLGIDVPKRGPGFWSKS